MNAISFMDLHLQYRSGKNDLKEYKETLKIKEPENNLDRIEIIASMINDMDDMSKALLQRTLHELHAVNADEVRANAARYNLTALQLKIVLRHNEMPNFTNIAAELGISPQAVFTSYQNSIRKIMSAKKKEIEGIPPGLSNQQGSIYKLNQQGLGPKEIALQLSTTSSSVSMQLNIIAKKIDELKKSGHDCSEFPDVKKSRVKSLNRDDRER